MKKLGKGIIRVAVGSILCTLGVYAWVKHEMQEAYRTSNYDRLHTIYKTGEVYSLDNVAKESKDLILKSSLEDTVRPHSKRNITVHFNPFWKIEWGETRYLTHNDLKYTSDWSTFSMHHTEKSKAFYDENSYQIIKDDLLDGKINIYEDLVLASERVDFKGKEVYQAACCLHYIFEALYYIDFETRIIQGMYKEGGEIDKYLRSIEKQVNFIKKSKDMQVSNFLVDTYEERVALSITEKKRVVEQYKERRQVKENIGVLSKSLYDKFIMFNEYRYQFPRDHKAAQIYEEVKEIMGEYEIAAK